MEEFIEFVKVSLSDIINGALNNGIPLLNDAVSTEGRIQEIVATFVIQFLIFIILFLVVRFKFWNIVTNYIETRGKAVDEELSKKDDAIKTLAEATEQAENLKAESKKEALTIVEQARKISKNEADAIKQQALEEIENEKTRAKEQLEHERDMMEKEIKDQIIEVAYEMSKTIVGREIDQAKNQDVVDEMLGKLEERK